MKTFEPEVKLVHTRSIGQWVSGASEPDSYVLFRGMFRIERAAELRLTHTGASFYRGYLDGVESFEGPPRFTPENPEYFTEEMYLESGEHVIGIEAHHEAIDTRILKNMPPFIWCQINGPDGPVDITWKCLPLESNKKAFLRINPQLGWVEIRDTRLDPVDWALSSFKDEDWQKPVFGVSNLPDPVQAKLSTVAVEILSCKPSMKGPLATTFGYSDDDPAYGFFSRDRSGKNLPTTGSWYRYDLGRVRLGRPSVALDLPAGTVVEIAMAEFLTDGKVSPTINFSLGRSCNMDRFIVRGGRQTIIPFTPKGGRYVEVHVLTAGNTELIPEFHFLERGYYSQSNAKFSCGDKLINRIWKTGIETFRACAEDALIDNPTRERGQWTGDVASVGMEIGSVAFRDLRPVRRALVQAAQCAREEDGLVAGLSPGDCAYLPTYASQWHVAVFNYFKHTGDTALLEELWPAAVGNMEAFLADFSEEGLGSVPGWNFIDWGYLPEREGIDLACNLHFVWSLRSMIDWGTAIGEDCETYVSVNEKATHIIERRLAGLEDREGLEGIGFHCLVLASILNLNDRERCLDYLKQYWLDCFPANPEGKRIEDPFNSNDRLVTPYFAHYLFPLLIESGHMDFAMDQYRKCWGWMLQDGRTTWMEVFDTRWSHCHQWAGCPTWQLSRYCLGLFPRYDIGPGCFDFKFFPGSLSSAKGRIPHPCGGWIEVNWSRDQDSIEYSITTGQPLSLFLPDGTVFPVDQASSFDPYSL